MCKVWWKKRDFVPMFHCIGVWTQLVQGSYHKALLELKFLACLQDPCKRRAITPMLDYEGGKSRYLPHESTSSSWTEHKFTLIPVQERLKQCYSLRLSQGRWIRPSEWKLALLTGRTHLKLRSWPTFSWRSLEELQHS